MALSVERLTGLLAGCWPRYLGRAATGLWIAALAGLMPALVGCGVLFDFPPVPAGEFDRPLSVGPPESGPAMSPESGPAIVPESGPVNAPKSDPVVAPEPESATGAGRAAAAGAKTGPTTGSTNDATTATTATDATASEGEAANLSVDRIAYINPYGDLFTVNPDGSEERRLTGGSQVQARPDQPAGFYQVQDLDFNNAYAWPTWSPDGSRLAVSRVQIAGNRSLQVSVQVLDSTTGRSRMVYENDVPALVADGAPHYLYWSPDGEYLSFLATTRQGLTLFAVNPATTEGAVALERGAPLYYSWGGDGDSLMIHSRAEVKLLRKPFRPDRALLLVDGVGFRTPALSPDGRRWAYAVSGATGSALYVGDTDSPAPARQVLELGPFSAFMWSPDSRTLAVADHQDPQGRIFQRIRLVDAAGGGVRTLVEEPLLSFYWAPNGERLAWVSVDTDDQVFEWKVAALDTGDTVGGGVNGGAVRELFRFRPSGEVFTMLSFFDQYAYSHSPWSPDSSRLVVAGSPGPVAERRNGHTPTGARVYVLDAVGDAPPLEIAAGSVAFWSWN